MNKIDLGRIIENYNLDTKEIASQLFPDVKYPKLALDRITKGEALLDTDQVSKLAIIIGVPIEKLFDVGSWKKTSKGKIIQFDRDDYVVKLDMETWVTRIYHNESMFHESILHNKTIPLSEYLFQITELINKHK